MPRTSYWFLAVVMGVLLFPVTPNARAQESQGALDIRIHPGEGELTPPAELLLTDPQKRRAGRGKRGERILSEIPHSSYESEALDDAVSGATGPETGILNVRNPEDGLYTAIVTGTESAAYSLEIRGYDRELSPSDSTFLNVEISKGEEHEYQIRYSSKAGSKISSRRVK